jgi:hypothetical protein
VVQAVGRCAGRRGVRGAEPLVFRFSKKKCLKRLKKLENAHRGIARIGRGAGWGRTAHDDRLPASAGKTWSAGQDVQASVLLSAPRGRACDLGVETWGVRHWAWDREADPTNGVCMSATFDRLFDYGLVTINDNLTLRVSKALLDAKDRTIAEVVAARHGQSIIPPIRFYPDPVCLRWHRDHRFRTV